MRERDFQENVTTLARMYGWLVYHTHDSRRSEPGFPDLVLVHPKRGVLFRELKSESGRMSPAQMKWIASLISAGADADVWRPTEMNRIKEELKP